MQHNAKINPSRVLLALFLSTSLGVSVNAQSVPAFTGSLLLQPVLSSAKCVTASANSPGAPVVLASCTGAPSQFWTFGGGVVKTFNGGKCLQVHGGTNADGTKLEVGDCNGSQAQKFTYSLWDNTFKWSGSNKCVDLTGGSLGDNNPIQIWSCSSNNANQKWDVGYSLSSLPETSQAEQFGTNNCGLNGESGDGKNCQTIWMNSAADFCLWAPPTLNTIGNAERETVAYCTKSGRGTRLIPNGALHGVHFVETADYVQVTGVGNFTGMNIRKGDSGGELDNRGADGRGNPVGGLVYGSSFGSGAGGPGLQYHEWTSFISESEFCFRACVGPRATELCNHIYDEMGCWWNMPANYDAGVFEDCDADDDLPMGVYGTSTWHQGVSPTPSGHPPAASSNCRPLPTVGVTPLENGSGQNQKRDAKEKSKRRLNLEWVPPFAGATPAPKI